jgi:hypothetical protein
MNTVGQCVKCGKWMAGRDSAAAFWLECYPCYMRPEIIEGGKQAPGTENEQAE